MKTYRVFFNNSCNTQEKRGSFIAEVNAIDEKNAAKQLNLNKFYLRFEEVTQ